MGSLKDIKRRITSVRKTQQITRAMRMVAGAKLRRAQEAIEAARPYADRMRATLAEVARAQRDSDHPLLVSHPEKRNVELFVITSDRGLCGAFNANVIKLAVATGRARLDAGAQVSISTAGKKAREAFQRRAPDTLRQHYPQDSWVTFGQAADAAAYLSNRYATGEVDEVVLVYSEFVSAITQTPRAVTLLPFTAGETEPAGAADGAGDELPFEIEPDPATLLAVLVPKAVEVEVFRALLENQSGEHAARMAAMEAATRNTEELISSLTLQYNRARQAAITKELVEIVSGAEAL
ncbi:MAG TPA: ATP synthase F1 subunit gamma [Myxococcota bacterium]|nr:ATP synthase F1 subunit gamma [Myxococcota bacterium]